MSRYAVTRKGLIHHVFAASSFHMIDADIDDGYKIVWQGISSDAQAAFLAGVEAL